MPELQSLAEIEKLCASDLRYAIQLNCRLLSLQPHPVQYAMADFLQGRGRPSWRRRKKVMLGFRYATKSFILRQYLKFRWRRNPYMQAILQSSSDDLAKNFVAAVLTSLRQDPTTESIAPPTSETGEYSFNLRGVRHEQGKSLRAAGIKTSLTGSRADLYVFDDPEPDDEPEALHDLIIRAIEQAAFILHPADRWLEHFRKTLDPTLTTVPTPEQTQLIVVGQPHTEETAYLPPSPDLYDEDEEAMNHPLADAAFLRIPAVGRNGWWVWPELFYSSQLGRIETPLEKSRTMSRRTWRLQMQIDPTPIMEEGAIIKETGIVTIDATPRAPVLFVDPADSEDGCEWAIAIGGMHKHKLHVLDLAGFHGEAYEGDVEDGSLGESAWAQCFELATEHGCVAVYLEKNLKAARAACMRYLQKTRIRMSVYEYAVRANKHRRLIDTLEQPFANAMVTLSPTVLHDRKNLRQLYGLTYRKLPNPNDRLDALAGLVGHFIELPGIAAVRDHEARKPGDSGVSRTYKRLKAKPSIYQRRQKARA